MSVNKNAQLRYNVLDKCFSNTGRRYTATDLLNAVNQALIDSGSSESGIQKRQLYMDIAFMESSEGWEIKLNRSKDGKKVIYRYENPRFSISNKPLNETEAAYLRSAVVILSRLGGAPQFEWMQEFLPRIQKELKMEVLGEHAIEFDSNDYLTGKEFLQPLFEAIIYRKVLRLQYQSFKREDRQLHLVHPLFLKQYNKRWFLFAWNAEFGDISNFPIDRIAGIKETGDTFKPHKEFKPDVYFEDIIGVTKPEKGKVRKIELRFSPNRAPYITTKPLHASQKANLKKLTKKGLKVTIEVIPNPELESLLLSFGPDVRVLKPVSLRKSIETRLTESLTQYKPRN